MITNSGYSKMFYNTLTINDLEIDKIFKIYIIK